MNKSAQRKVISVVFDFDIESRNKVGFPKEYSYFFKGDVTEGDIVLLCPLRTVSRVRW